MNVFGLFTSVVAFYLLAPEPYFPVKPHLATTIASLLLQVLALALVLSLVLVLLLVLAYSSSTRSSSLSSLLSSLSSLLLSQGIGSATILVSSYSCALNAALAMPQFGDNVSTCRVCHHYFHLIIIVSSIITTIMIIIIRFSGILPLDGVLRSWQFHRPNICRPSL